jgi:hypothetical protein
MGKAKAIFSFSNGTTLDNCFMMIVKWYRTLALVTNI